MYTSNGQRLTSPIYDSPAQQVAFLFHRLADFIEQAEQHRVQKEYEQFAFLHQRSYALAQGLLEWLVVESGHDPKAETSPWHGYFLNVMGVMRSIMLTPNADNQKALLDNLRTMAAGWKDHEIAYRQKMNDQEASSFKAEWV